MNEEVTTEVTKAINKETVEQAIEFILEEGKEQGYQEAMKIYGKQYSEVIRRGRRQGFVIALILALGGVIAFEVNKKKIDAKLKEIFGPKEDKVKNVDDEVKDADFEELKE